MSASMAATEAGYQVRVTTYTLANVGAWELCLRADPRRVYVEFHHQAGGNINVGPNGVQRTGIGSWTDTYVAIWKWRDCPAIVSGDWYVLGMIADTLTIIEELNVGEG